jgi:tetratricopeptide (TPR) repeat protein
LGALFQQRYWLLLSPGQTCKIIAEVRSSQVVRLRYLLPFTLALVAMAQAPPPAAPSSALAAAREAFNRGEFQKSAAEYQLVVEKNGLLPEAHTGLVRSLLKQDDVDAAEQASAAALRLLPGSALVLAADGDVKFRRGLLQEAQDRYQAAISLDEKCARAWLGMGRVYAAGSRRKQSREAFARAHDLDANDGDIVYYWALGLEFPRNVAELQKQMDKYRDDAERERHEREYIAFLQALAGRKVWIPAHDIARTELKLEPVISRLQDGPRAFSLRVRLNDTANATVMVDTGASGLTISRRVAEKARAIELSEHSLEGVGNAGPAKGYEAWVEKVAIGELEFHDCHVHVSPRDSPDYDGLIGTDVFEQYLVTIDFPAHKLRLEPLTASAKSSGNGSASAMQSFTSFYRFGHMMLIPTGVGDSAHGLFILDTGSSTNSMSPGMARQVSKIRSSDIAVNGMSGSVSHVFTADQTVLQFSRFRQPHENMITIDLHGLSKDLGTEISGLIGFATLKQMKVIIDYRDGLVDFDYKE